MSNFPQKSKENKFIIKLKKFSKHEWSEYQKAIFKEIAQASDPNKKNLIVIARAGCSKTTVLVEGMKYVPKKQTALFCAFSKAIQEELQGRIKGGQCRTLHSLGFAALRARFGNNIKVNNNKCWEIVEDLVGNPKENYDLIDNICKAVKFCKANLVDTPVKIDEIISKYDIDLCEVENNVFHKYVIQTMRKCKEKTDEIDYNDMVWMPFVYGLNIGKFAYVFIDECQDLSRNLIELALTAVQKPNGRIIAVLDDRQAIFSFAGSDTQILQILRERLEPQELMLPICYRCPIEVIKLAQTIVPDIQAHPNAIQGTVINLNISEIEQTIKPGDVLLSRFNAPLVKYCFKFLKQGIPSNILGRDIGDGLLYLVKKSKKKKVIDLLSWLTKWEKQEKEKLISKYPNANTDNISDKAECVRALCEDAGTIEEIKENCKKLFQDGDNNKLILCSSIHRFKGSERDNVFVLADTLRDFNEEELNISYVAFTRSRQKLYLVRKPSKWAQYDDKPEEDF